MPIIFAEPIDIFENSIFDLVIERRQTLFKTNPGFLTGECLINKYCFPNTEYSTKARIFNFHSQIDSNIIDLRKYDFIIIAAFNGYYQYINWLRKELPHKIIILIQDDSIEEMQYSHSSLQVEMIKSINNANGFISYQREMTSFVRVCNKNVLYIHHPINPSFHPKTEIFQEEKLICIGIGTWNYDFSNLLTSISVFRRLKNDFDNFLHAEFLGAHDYIRQELLSSFNDPEIEFTEWSKYGNYYSDLSKYKLILNLNGRAVAGRVSAEAALLNIPVIGNIKADMQFFCWPRLSVDIYNAIDIYKLSERILTDHEFTNEQISFASNQIEFLKGNYYIIGKEVLSFIKKLML